MCDFFLGEKLELTDEFHLVDFVESVDSGADSLEVGERTAEPSLVDVEHIATFCLLLDSVLCLFLRADEKNGLAFLNDALDELIRCFYVVNGDLKVDDVNIVSRCVDVLAHLRVPTLCLVSEVHACFEQGFHCCYGHCCGPPKIVCTFRGFAVKISFRNKNHSATVCGRFGLYYI